MGQVAELRGRRVLIVEDEFLVADTLREILEEAGAVVLGPIGRVDEAVAFIANRSASIDVAVIDLNLHGERSYPVADALRNRGIRFVFATGYDADVIECDYRNCPRCVKPFRLATLIAALTA